MFPGGIAKYGKSIELCKWFSRPWKSIGFGQLIRKVLKKYENSKFSHLFIQILFFIADDSLQMFFALCSMSKFLKNEDKW